MKNIPIILKKIDKLHQYLVKISDDLIYTKNYKYEKIEQYNKIYFSTEGLDCYIDNINTYTPFEGQTDENLPTFIPSRKIQLCFPEYNIGQNVYYMITFKMWLTGKEDNIDGKSYEVILGQFLINPKSRLAMAHEMYKTFRYTEYTEMWIPDPWALMYDSNWDAWREHMCYEISDINNSGSPLSIEICPVEYGNDGLMISHISDPGYSNVILNKSNDYLSLNLSMSERSDFIMDIKYNSSYDDLKSYLEKTYYKNIEDLNVRWEIVIKNEEMVYYMNEYSGGNEESCKFEKEDFDIINWDQYIDGLFITGSADLMDGNSVIMTIFSNSIPLIPDIYKFLITTDIDTQNIPIKINEIQMINYNVDVVNKIQKNVIQVDNAKDYKSGLIKPVFFQTHPIRNIIIHPQVTENININLDSYKSKTDFFYIRVEGVDFSEIGRIRAGVIFKIQGSLLPNKKKEGIYYILDANKEMITSGNYQYVE